MPMPILLLRRLAVVGCLVLLSSAASAQLVADLSADPLTGDNPLAVQFTDESTGGTAHTWFWDFGDGGGSSLQHPVHTYTAPGRYDVSLQVIGLGFQIDSVTYEGLINVLPAPVVVGFSQSAFSGSGSLDVDFADTSSGAEVTGWLWDFGDGTTSTEPAVSHTYLGGGPVAYDVSLTVSVEQQTETLVREGAVQLGPSRFAAPRFVLPFTGVDTLQPIDLDDDGDQDLMVSGGSGTRWLTNDGSGHFAAPQLLGEAVRKLLAADFDGDGRDDLLAIGYDHLTWMAQQAGTPPFAAPIPIEVVPYFFGGDADVGDVDGDGHLDPVYSPGERGASWYPNTLGDGSFAEPQLMTPDDVQVSGLELADVDLDGDLDLVWDASWEDQVAWAQNLAGDGSAWSQHTIAQIEYPRELVVTDLDQDGDPDALWTGMFGFASLTWARNPWPSTAPWPLLPLDQSSAYEPLRVADLDGDGEDDVLYNSGGFVNGALVWRAGQVDPGPRTILDMRRADAVAIADVDGDLDLDVFSLHEFGGFELVLHENLTDGAAWSLAGASLSGVEGLPTLYGGGALLADDVVSLAVEGAAPGAPATLVLGLTALELPFKGGLLVPFPDVLVSLQTDVQGRLMLQAPWPADVPAGLDVYAQLWVLDAAGIAGFAATNALSVSTQ